MTALKSATAQQFLEVALQELDPEGVNTALSLGANADQRIRRLLSKHVMDDMGPTEERVSALSFLSLLRLGMHSDHIKTVQGRASEAQEKAARVRADQQAAACLSLLFDAGYNPLIGISRQEFSACARHAPKLFRELVKGCRKRKLKDTAHQGGGMAHALLGRGVPTPQSMAVVIRHEPNLSAVNSKGQTPLHVFWSQDNGMGKSGWNINHMETAIAVTRLCVDNGADLLAVDGSGRSVLLLIQQTLPRYIPSLGRPDAGERIKDYLDEMNALELGAAVTVPDRNAPTPKM